MAQDQFRSHKDLMLWQRSMHLATNLYRWAGRLPSAERYGLAGQIRRCAVSIPSNIAEGAARRTTREFLSFLYIARGSWAELDTQLLLANQLGYLSTEEMERLQIDAEEVGRLLNSVITALRRRLSGSSP